MNYRDDGTQRQLTLYAISAKRYVLFTEGDDGNVELVKPSQHGLGHLLPPYEQESSTTGNNDEGDSDDCPKWVVDSWRWILESERGMEPPDPAWFPKPAISRVTVSSPELLKTFSDVHPEAGYQDSVKPMNFVLSAHVAPFGHPDGADPNHFHLLAPFSTDPIEWLENEWIDKYSGDPYPIAVGHGVPPNIVQVVSYGDVLHHFLVHPEAKSADVKGIPCGRGTKGLLHRRHVRIGPITYIGKESNRLDEVQHGLVHHVSEVRAMYQDPRRDLFWTDVVPVLRCMSIEWLAKRVRVSSRTIKAWRSGASRPGKKNYRKVMQLAVQFSEDVMRDPKRNPTAVPHAERLLRSPMAEDAS